MRREKLTVLIFISIAIASFGCSTQKIGSKISLKTVAASIDSQDVKMGDDETREILALSSAPTNISFGFGGSSGTEDILAFILGYQIFTFPMLKISHNNSMVSTSLAKQEEAATLIKFDVGLKKEIHSVISSNKQGGKIDRNKMAKLLVKTFDVYSLKNDRLTGYFSLGCWSGIIANSVLYENSQEFKETIISLGETLIDGLEKDSSSKSKDKKLAEQIKKLIEEYKKPSQDLSKILNIVKTMQDTALGSE